MSGMRHATISAWQRQEDGSYAAEIGGWTLRVRWRPESTGTTHSPARGFVWEAGRALQKLSGAELFEEIELAMADAEAHVAALDQAAHAASGPADPADAARASAPGHGHH
jgi:hypothetical protein